MKIAFATTDKININSDFGSAEKFDVYEISKSGYNFLDTICVEKQPETTQYSYKNKDTILKVNKGENDSDIAAVINALNDCTIIYTTSIGAVPAAKLIKNGITPMTPELDKEEIIGILDRLLIAIKGNPAPWLRKVLQKNNQSAEE
ncbi:nitrogen fixation protein NifX homolog [Calothrix sp. NIES-4071]|nr:nitrogen fixation protein NifX homolog [Calothrix sp. NIES-4071]BAZ64304.1 nitrogen fixation protein NifX homolog [Calothrix sp. NIES-4105]